MSEKKKKPLFVKLLLTLFIILGILILLAAGWFVFCYFNRTSSINALPKDYTAYVRTDSAWEAVEPMLDLKAMVIFLSDPKFVQFRELFLELRKSELRKSPLIAKALSRRIDGALYDNNDYIAIIDMGILSGISRLAPFAINFVKVEGLSYHKDFIGNYFEYSLNPENSIYVKTYKNLVICCSNKELFQKSISMTNKDYYSKNELKFLTEKLDQPFRITANGKKLLSLLGEDNEYVKSVTNYLSSEELSSINFGITDSQIQVDIKIPYTISDNQSNDNPVVKLLTRDSKVPSLLSKLPESVQYYTFITAGTLQELKDAAFKIISLQSDLYKKWQNANNVSQMMLKASADDILFSWTGDEYAVLGLEGKAEPVFVIQIKDEKQRRYIFDTILSSAILNSDSSLLIDGIRLPRIELPSYLHNLLEGFGVHLPKPYYTVKDNYIYFSQSPENLATISAAYRNGAKLNKNETWKKVSETQSPYSSVSLYYNLERSIPFFIRGNSVFSKILQLYNIGRADVSIKDNTIYMTLSSIACQNTSTKAIPGFPLNLENKAISVLNQSVNEKGHLIFWAEQNCLKSLNTSSLEVNSKEIPDIAWVINSNELVFKNTKGEVWAVTKDGTVFLFDGNLTEIESFPLITGIKAVSQIVNYANGILLIDSDGLLLYINSNGEKLEYQLDTLNDIMASPSVLNNNIAVYEKGFTGEIHKLNSLSKEEDYELFDVDGLAYGSPCLIEVNKQTYTSIITQTGKLYLWNSNNTLQEGFPIQIDDIFYLNLKSCNNFMIGLSANGNLYKIDLKGNVTKISISHLTAKTGYITICDYNNDKSEEIFICGDGNTIYGFNKDLEFLNGFPVSGYGSPIFADIDGDKKNDCLILSVDNNLNAWSLR